MGKKAENRKRWTHREKNRARCFACGQQKPEPIRGGMHLSCRVAREVAR